MHINYYNPYVRRELYIMHHGINGQRWGQRNGPPYPLAAGDHSASERKAGWEDSLNASPRTNDGISGQTGSGGEWSQDKKVAVGKKLLSSVLQRVDFPSKSEHFNRNNNMPIDKLPKSIEECLKLGWDGNVASDCHQFTSKDKSNRKFVSPDGRLEAIFDGKGKLVLKPEDFGTFNLASPIDDPLGHFVQDVIPWIVYGNTPDDSTSVAQRLKAFSVNGGVNVIKNKIRFNK